MCTTSRVFCSVVGDVTVGGHVGDMLGGGVIPRWSYKNLMVSTRRGREYKGIIHGREFIRLCISRVKWF